MDRNKLENIIDQNENLYAEIRKNSYAKDESETASQKLWITIWKNGDITVSLTQQGNDYPPETYSNIEEIIELPRVPLYDNYDIQSALDQGISEEEIFSDALQTYMENFDMSTYLDMAREFRSIRQFQKEVE